MVDGDIRAEQLIGTWYHSHEEDHGGRSVYRPETFGFPPSRGRFGMTLSADGRANWLGPAPDDRMQSGAATWSLEAGQVRIEHGGLVESFDVVRVSAGGEIVLEKPR